MQPSDIKEVELRPLEDNDKDYESLEADIRALFKKEIYLPLVKALAEKANVLKNSKEGLLEAIRSGRIQFYRGTFSGRFSSGISKEIKSLGGKWERKTGTWKLPQTSLPLEVRNAISASEVHFQTKIDAIDRHLAQILPEEIADKLKVANHFDRTLWKVEKEFHGSLRNITVGPQLSVGQGKRIAQEWQKNTELSIVDWTQKEVAKLRKDIRESVYAGNRNKSIIKIIQKSHDSSISKAKFIARQETRLLLTKFKQTRYEDAGVNWYKWGISNHPVQAKNGKYVKGMVRHDHGVLANKKFRWDTPPITNTTTGARNNPGQDFNCRCYAIPIVMFKGSTNK